MIGLSAPDFDVNGSVVVPTRFQNPYQGERRGTVTATLDGGVSVYDGGFTVADQTLSAKLNSPPLALLQSLHYLVSLYGQLVVTCESGCYRAVVTFAVNNNTLVLSARIVARLD